MLRIACIVQSTAMIKRISFKTQFGTTISFPSASLMIETILGKTNVYSAKIKRTHLVLASSIEPNTSASLFTYENNKAHKIY